MFEFFRKGVASMFAGVLLALLIASFALWGIGDPLSTFGSSDVVKVGDEKITPPEFARYFETEFARDQQRFGESFTKEIAVQFGYGTQVVNRMAERKAYDVEAKNLGLRISDQELRDYVFAIPAFQDADGTFNPTYFAQIAASQGFSPNEFEELLRGELVRSELFEGLFNNVKATEISTETLTKYVTEERTAEILSIPASTMTGYGEATEEDIKAFYDENSENYMAPEYRDISYIEFSVNEIEDTIEISEEEAIASYESRITEFTTEEQRGFIQMLLDDEETADLAYEDLQNGKSFEEVVLERTGETAEDSQFEPTPREEFADIYGEDVADQVFALQENGYTPPIDTAVGVYIFKVTSVSDRTAETYEDAKDQVIADLKANKALDQLYELQDRIADELAAGSLLNEIADAVALPLKRVNNVSAQGLTPDGTASQELPLIVDFLDEAFASSIGDELDLKEGIANKFYMLSVDNITERRLRELSEVRDTVIADWEKSRREVLATELATKITDEYKANESSEKSLADYKDMASNLVVNEVTAGRNNQDNTVSDNIHTSIFAQDIGNIEMIPSANGDGFVLVRVKSRAFAEVEDEAAIEETRNQISNSYQGDIVAVYAEYLFNSLPVKINEAAAQATLEQIVAPVSQ